MKTITLKHNGVGRYDDVSPFIITDKKLELKINLPNFNGEFYLIVKNNDAKIKRLIPSNGEICLDGLSAGEVLAEVKHYLKGELIKTYTVEPLLLKEVDGTITAEPEIAALWRDIAAVRNLTDGINESLTALNNALTLRENELKQREEKLNQKVKALLRFAFADYSQNVYLGGGTAEDFAKEFGLELTEEEIKEIIGGAKND